MLFGGEAPQMAPDTASHGLLHTLFYDASPTEFVALKLFCAVGSGVLAMGWSEEVHARRLLDIKARRKKEKAVGKYAVPEVKGNAGTLPMAILIGELF